MMLRWDGIFLKLVLCCGVVGVVGVASAHELKPLALQKDWNLRLWNSEKFLVSTPKDELYFARWEQSNAVLKLESSAKNFSKAQFSPDNKFFLIRYENSSEQSEVHVFESVHGKRVLRSENFVGGVLSYWLDNCRFAVVQKPSISQTTASEAKLNVVRRPDPQCSTKFEVASSPLKAMRPRAFWSDAHYNIWAFYENGSRQLMNWIGKGSFFDFTLGAEAFFWFRESSSSSLVYRADGVVRKIQPLSANIDLFAAREDRDLLYYIKQNAIYEIKLDSKFKTQEVIKLQLKNDFKPQRIEWDGYAKRLILRDDQGQYWQYTP